MGLGVVVCALRPLTYGDSVRFHYMWGRGTEWEGMWMCAGEVCVCVCVCVHSNTPTHDHQLPCRTAQERNPHTSTHTHSTTQLHTSTGQIVEWNALFQLWLLIRVISIIEKTPVVALLLGHYSNTDHNVDTHSLVQHGVTLSTVISAPACP